MSDMLRERKQTKLLSYKVAFVSFALMIRESENLSMFQFTFLWATMCVSALLSLVLLKNLEDKI